MISALVGFVIGVLLGAGGMYALKPTVDAKMRGLSDGD